mmetsp:Transcript_113923/g.318262  ORF Transcript_113923/g.318262 Transcript_113923/m.318262 type:complete len:257 (-) Transcript_113923:53-823(-)
MHEPPSAVDGLSAPKFGALASAPPASCAILEPGGERALRLATVQERKRPSRPPSGGNLTTRLPHPDCDGPTTHNGRNWRAKTTPAQKTAPIAGGNIAATRPSRKNAAKSRPQASWARVSPWSPGRAAEDRLACKDCSSLLALSSSARNSSHRWRASSAALTAASRSANNSSASRCPANAANFTWPRSAATSVFNRSTSARGVLCMETRPRHAAVSTSAILCGFVGVPGQGAHIDSVTRSRCSSFVASSGEVTIAEQ